VYKINFLIIIFLAININASMTPNQQKIFDNLTKNYDLQGPNEIYNITATCDKKNIDKIESTLKGEEIHIIDYKYNVYLIIKDHKISKVSVKDFNGTDKLKSCIENEILNTIKLKKLPKKGLIPISIKFPAFITKKTETREIGTTGSVFGKQPKHCFHFKAPVDWVLDTKSGVKSTLPVVFYHKNATWGKTGTIMYARTAVYSQNVKSIQDQVDETVKIWTKSFGYNKKVIFVENIISINKTKGKIYFFPKNDNRDSNEYVAYFLAKNTINYFVLHTSDKNHKKLLPILKELALTYRESNDCSSCCKDGDTSK
jgi:hypothetical protein